MKKRKKEEKSLVFFFISRKVKDLLNIFLFRPFSLFLLRFLFKTRAPYLSPPTRTRRPRPETAPSR
jgi:hypothetical protein